MRIVIIGNGVAGNAAAEVLAHSGSGDEITLISREEFPYYSACVLPAYLAGEVPPEKFFLKPAQAYARAGITVILGREIDEIDPVRHRVWLGKESLPYDKLILATGSRPVVPPFARCRSRKVIPLKGLGEGNEIIRNLGAEALVIGGGPVGVEMAVTLRKRGANVTLIEAMEAILPRSLGPGFACRVQSVLEENGVRVLAGEKVESISENKNGLRIRTVRRELRVDLVVLAVGMEPETALAQGADIPVGRGIRTNLRMETGCPDVLACGDCAEVVDPHCGVITSVLLWPNAFNQGKVAGLTCRGESRAFTGPVNIVNLDVFGIFVGSFGKRLTEYPAGEACFEEREFAGGSVYLVSSRGRVVGGEILGRGLPHLSWSRQLSFYKNVVKTLV